MFRVAAAAVHHHDWYVFQFMDGQLDVGHWGVDHQAAATSKARLQCIKAGGNGAAAVQPDVVLELIQGEWRLLAYQAVKCLLQQWFANTHNKKECSENTCAAHALLQSHLRTSH